MNDETLAERFSALGDVRRLRALRFIARHDPTRSGSDDGVCACHVQEHLELSQPATSYHMKVLRQAGLVRAEKRGRWVHYRISRDGLAALGAFVTELDDATGSASRAVA
jgi:ArsR family transcriptional regulator